VPKTKSGRISRKLGKEEGNWWARGKILRSLSQQKGHRMEAHEKKKTKKKGGGKNDPGPSKMFQPTAIVKQKTGGCPINLEGGGRGGQRG